MRRVLSTVVAAALAGTAWAETPIVDLRFELAYMPALELEVQSANQLLFGAREDADLDGSMWRTSLVGWADIVAPHEDEPGLGFALATSLSYMATDVMSPDGGGPYSVEMRGYGLNLGTMFFYQFTPHVRLEGGPYGGFTYLEERVERFNGASASPGRRCSNRFRASSRSAVTDRGSTSRSAAIASSAPSKL